MKDQGIVIAGGRAGNISGGWGEHLNLGAPKGKIFPRSHGFDGNSQVPGLVQKSLIGRDAGLLPTHKHSGTKVAQDGKHSPHVIAVRVGEGDGIESAEDRGTITGDTTSSPISKLALEAWAPPMGPPASMSRVFPWGETSRSESPWPTSIAVTSSTPGW